jgi:RNA:NAD 2'-phosphotransferase (TPT1/KptA family)/8-oxo-dGTP pyrophosphatase MutT (NUDIX family)
MYEKIAPIAVSLDLNRLSRTLFFLMRHGAGPAGLEADAEGWFPVDQVARAAARAIRRPVAPDDVRDALVRYGMARFEVEAERVRLRAPGWGPTRTASRPGGPFGSGPGPDILYHALPRQRLGMVMSRGSLTHPGGGTVQLSRAEDHAWRVAHRMWEDPMVLYVDAARARRDGVNFMRTRSGQYATPSVPVRHVLNLREGFAEQASAGGFLVDWSTGSPRIALIKVCRRGGSTWEVAKGKIEAGESPESAAVREVREEMGVCAGMKVSGSLGTIRYGFCTPDGSPRLKTIHLYVIEATECVSDFTPASREGIDDVRWFDLDEALNSLGHPSLRGSIGRLLAALEERAAELGVKMASSA